MEGISRFWRVGGSLPVPAAADDEGLLSRVADIFEQRGDTLIEERFDRVSLASADNLLGRYAPRFPWLFDRIEVRRHGIRGWRSLHFDRTAPQLLALETVGGGMFITGALAEWGGLSVAYPLTIAACILLYFWLRRQILKQTRALLRRAFET